MLIILIIEQLEANRFCLNMSTKFADVNEPACE
jgi:hypothetical protein